jgi:hypothetical protein
LVVAGFLMDALDQPVTNAPFGLQMDFAQGLLPGQMLWWH